MPAKQSEQTKSANGRANTLQITQIKSAIGYNQRQRATLRALGLRHLGQTVTQADTPVIRGMIAKVSHLVAVEEEVST